MKSLWCQLKVVSCLLILVVTWEPGVRGHPCPRGQVAHVENGNLSCCLPVDCEPNHYLTFCKENGTKDICDSCPKGYALFRRISSFSYGNCHPVNFEAGNDECKLSPGADAAAEEDRKNCLCNLEAGEYYREPQVPSGPHSYCQPFGSCGAGYQPTQRGVCEPCPRNTVQDENESNKLCRPQRNCTAMGLEVEVAGSTSRVTVCAQPPSITTRHPTDGARHTTTPAPSSTTTGAPVVNGPDDDVSVQPSLNSPSNSDVTVVVVVVVVLGVLILAGVVVFVGYRRRWWTWMGKCRRQHAQNQAYQDGQLPMSGRDGDNTSDNSCCACADSCLTTSHKSSSSCAGKSAVGVCEQSKQALPMLQAYVNRNGKGDLDSSLEASLSEPFYNSISHDGSYRLQIGTPPGYTNVPGSCKPGVHNGGDFSHPLPSRDQDRSLDKDLYAQTTAPSRRARDQAQAGVGAPGRSTREREDCTETDPLLPGSENSSCGVPTPVPTLALRGILRRPGGRQEVGQELPRDAGTVAGGVNPAPGGEVGSSGGNRPHLSMLLGGPDDTPTCEDVAMGNRPFLSQLVSDPHSAQPPLPNLLQQQELPAAHQAQDRSPLVTQQLQCASPVTAQQRQDSPATARRLHDSPSTARRFQGSPATAQQNQNSPASARRRQDSPATARHQGSPAVPRLAPVMPGARPAPEPSLVQMEELKPVMPHHASPTGEVAPHTPAGQEPLPAPIGARQREAGGSPARISPSQQQQVRGGYGQVPVVSPSTAPKVPVSPSTVTKTPAKVGLDEDTAKKEGKIPAPQQVMQEETAVKELGEETYRKQGMPAASPDSEDTMQKSVAASSGLGDSLELSSPLDMLSDDLGRSRTPYRRSNSEASRSVSPAQPLPPSRSISSPEEKHRPFAVVKPMQSDQSLNAISSSQDCLTEITQMLDVAGRQFPLNSLRGHGARRQISQESSSDDHDQTRPKTPDRLSEDEDDVDGEAGRMDREASTAAEVCDDNDLQGTRRRGASSERKKDHPPSDSEG